MDFNTKAQEWDDERRIKRAEEISSEILSSIGEAARGHALEFGCGTGLISFCLAGRFEHITLIDTSAGMIEVLADKIKDRMITNMTPVLADINADEEVRNARYDVIYTSMALHHIPDTEATLRKLYGMLSDGGCLCIVELTGDDGSFHRLEKDFEGHNGFDPIALGDLMGRLGYGNVKSHVFYSGFKPVEGLKIPYSLFLLTAEK